MLTRWQKHIRDEDAAYRLWYVEKVIPWYRDEWPKRMMEWYHTPSIVSQFVVPKENT